jgi:hypothetical protein
LSVSPKSIWASLITTIIKFKVSCIANTAIYSVVGSRTLFALLRAEEALVQYFIGIGTERAEIIAFGSQQIKTLSTLKTGIVVCIPTS